MNNREYLTKESILSINLKRNDSFLLTDNTMSTQSIKVKNSNKISIIFDVIGFPNRYAKIVFNGQILCPELSFDFYNIHNNDTISIICSGFPISLFVTDLFSNDKQKNSNSFLVATPIPLSISHKRTQLHSKSSNYFKKILKNNNKSIFIEKNEKQKVN